MANKTYDCIVIGGGKAGKTLAPVLVAAGKKAALVELSPSMIGGTCINVGCIPTKTLLASAESAHSARTAPAFGIKAEAVVDASVIAQRKRSVVEAMRAMNRKNLDNALGSHLYFGTARFTGRHTVEVTSEAGETQSLEAREIFINTGTHPVIPSIEGLAESGFLTSETLLNLDVVAEHLVIVGGGFVALEFAHMHRQFGSRVTLVVRGPQLLPQFDPEIAAAVQKQLESEGIEVLLNTTVKRVSRKGTETFIAIDGPKGPQTVTASHLLVAAGRGPNTSLLNLDAAGVRVDSKGFVVVNERLETSAPGIWALGDVNGGPQFTHASLDDFRVVKANLLDGGSRSTRDRLIPSCLFLEPELAHIGLTERQAQGQAFRVARLDASQIPRAKTLGKTVGVLKALVADDDRILGCTLFCHSAGEMISTVQTAMTAGLSFKALRDAVLAHPTMTEGLNMLFAATPAHPKA